MPTALIGYTGFVGGTLLRQTTFDDQYNSANIEQIRGHNYHLVVCAGAPATKWKANQNPTADRRNLQYLTDNLKHVQIERFVLISTIDVYPTPQNVDEDTPIDSIQLQPYGKHRYELELFVQKQFDRVHIIRLPGLFGQGLKKNFIFDLLQNREALSLTHRDSVFQFYNMERLWTDIQIVLHYDLPLVNLATEPVRASDVAQRCFDVNFDNITEKPPLYYDMHSKFTALFGSSLPDYLYSAEDTFRQISKFVQTEREKAS